MKRLLIAGIDPGTTLGYALLDLQGNVVKINSSKQLEMSSLILEMIKEGRVIIVGTDKGKTPKFVEKLASKIGAKIIKPEEDIKSEEKRELTKGYDFSNEHERDALASAIFAFKRVRSLVRKVDEYAKEHDKERISEQIKEELLKNGKLNIAGVVAGIERPEQKKEKKRKRKKTGKKREEEYFEGGEEGDFEEMKKRETTNEDIGKIIRARMKKIIRVKNERLKFLSRKINEQEVEIEKLKAKLERIQEMIKKSDKNIILKKIKNLSWEEIQKEELGKIIYVEDPNIFSEKSIEKIRENVEIITSKKEMSKRVVDKFKVIFINANNLDMEDEDGIILINKEKLEKEKKKINILKKVIEEYREMRI
ncbi:MAG: DUF460 domain-containing protein [Candidatus Nanoarchaeia archaeon]